MKQLRSYAPPLILLAIILAFSLWCIGATERNTDRWRAQLQQADSLAASGDWPGAVEALQSSYDDWREHQTYLHIVARHDGVDDAETMYRRAMAFAAVQELSEFRAEMADLRDQLRLIAETERFSIKNVL